MIMKVTDADREFGSSIADVVANLVGQVDDPVCWLVEDVVAGSKASPEMARKIKRQLQTALAPVLEGHDQPDEALRRRCAVIYIDWLVGL